MKIRRNDKDGDWTFGHSLVDYYVNNSGGVGQKIKTRILEWVDDCFFNRQAGIDYRIRMGQRGQRAALDEDIRNIIINTEEVISLERYESTIYDRDLRVEFLVYHIYSQLPYAGSVIIEGVQYG